MRQQKLRFGGNAAAFEPLGINHPAHFDHAVGGIRALQRHGADRPAVGLIDDGEVIRVGRLLQPLQQRSIVIATLRGVVFIGIGMLILPTFLGERGIWLTLVLSEVLTLIVSIFLVRRSVVFRN